MASHATWLPLLPRGNARGPGARAQQHYRIVPEYCSVVMSVDDDGNEFMRMSYVGRLALLSLECVIRTSCAKALTNPSGSAPWSL